jgi:hypothetical protein
MVVLLCFDRAICLLSVFVLALSRPCGSLHFLVIHALAPLLLGTLTAHNTPTVTDIEGELAHQSGAQHSTAQHGAVLHNITAQGSTHSTA